MTAIGYAWEIVVVAFILIALMYWCFLEGAEDEDEPSDDWNAIDETNRSLREARQSDYEYVKESGVRDAAARKRRRA